MNTGLDQRQGVRRHAHVGRYFREGLARGERVLGIATPEHTTAVVRQLKTEGIDTDAAAAEGRLVLADAARTLAQFLVNDVDDSVPALGSSGFSADEARRRFGGGIVGFVQKPYTVQRLSEAVTASVKQSSRTAS